MEDAQIVNSLVRRCIAGDAVAWEEIVQRYNRRIYNICYRFAGSSDDAQDLTQEVFIKMYRTLSSYDVERGAFMEISRCISARWRMHRCPRCRCRPSHRSTRLRRLRMGRRRIEHGWIPIRG